MNLREISFIHGILEITSVLDSSNDPEELKYYWQEWYNKAGAPVRADFDKYVALNKEAAVLNSKKAEILEIIQPFLNQLVHLKILHLAPRNG